MCFSLHKMSKRLLIGITYILFCLSVYSQDYNQLTDTGEFTQAGCLLRSLDNMYLSGEDGFRHVLYFFFIYTSSDNHSLKFIHLPPLPRFPLPHPVGCTSHRAGHAGCSPAFGPSIGRSVPGRRRVNRSSSR